MNNNSDVYKHSQVSEAGYYSHLTQTVHIRNLSSSEVRDFFVSIRDKNVSSNSYHFDDIRRIARPIVHELKHWVDMNCSIRGINVLEDMLNVRNGDVSQETRLRLKQSIGMNLFVEKSGVAVPEPWRIGMSVSIPKFHEEIHHLSLCFMEKEESKQAFCKAPIYLGSMLECGAFFQELREGAPLATLHDGWLVERNELSKEARRFVYDSAMVEYHALAHFIAIHLRTEDILDAYAVASGLCFLLLNMPWAMLQATLKEAEEFFAQDPRMRHIRALLHSWPREAIFYYAAMQIGTVNSLGVTTTENIFELTKSWRAAKTTFFEQSHEEFCSALKKVTGFNNPYINGIAPTLMENNRALLEQRTLNPAIMGLRLPSIFFDDFILPMDTAFSGIEDYYMSNTNDSLVLSAISIEKNRVLSN